MTLPGCTRICSRSAGWPGPLAPRDPGLLASPRVVAGVLVLALALGLLTLGAVVG